MDNNALIAIVAVVAIVALGLAIWSVVRKRQSAHLRDQFGPEYGKAVETFGGPRSAERELAAREKRVKSFDIRPLSLEQHRQFTREWQEVQTRFVDDPSKAVADADRLVKELMQARGYPMVDFEQRAADISVDHPEVVNHYRSAREIAVTNREGKASTEELRQALVHYRALFEDLLESAPPQKRASAR